MRRVLSSGLVALGLVSAPPSGEVKKPEPGHSRDYRYAALWRFFSGCDCPAKDLAASFLQAADDNGLDWRLLPSLAFLESTGGKLAQRNNMFGWDEGRARFQSLAASIHTVGYRLATQDGYRGKNTNGILQTYNTNAGYRMRVRSTMHQISPVR